MQVYRGMDIGTAKPSLSEQAEVPHHMIDLVDPADEYSVAEFQTTARKIIADSHGPILISGGSGLHFRAVVDPLEFAPHDERIRTELETLPAQESADRLAAIDPRAPIDTANPRRVVRALEVYELTGETPTQRANRASSRDVSEFRSELEFQAVGIDSGPVAAERVSRRLQRMRESGLVDEVAGLVGRLGRTASQAVGYKELLPVVAGEKTVEEGFAAARAATLRLVKRQRTFFRRDPRIHWLPWCDDVSVLADSAERVLQ